MKVKIQNTAKDYSKIIWGKLKDNIVELSFLPNSWLIKNGAPFY